MKAPTQDKDKTPGARETDSSHSCFDPTDFHGVGEYSPWKQPENNVPADFTLCLSGTVGDQAACSLANVYLYVPPH